ncbi:MAG: BamA/TamA family outer membrane protein [Flavobacteriales bacterium]|nr:MAG: BamA/TamA family outer membrane protein [Flavobacteriales bacterium]
MVTRHWWLIALMAIGPWVGASAQRAVVQFEADAPLPKRFDTTIELKDGWDIAMARQAAVNDLLRRGHLEATVDSCRGDSMKTVCALHVGPKYRWARLSVRPGDAALAAEGGYRQRNYDVEPITPASVATLLNGILDHCSKHGYPFAKTGLDSLRQEAEGLNARLWVDKGRSVKIDSVIVKGTAKTNMRYLYAHLGVRPGDLYDETVIRNLETRIRELAFVQQKQRPYVQFTQEHTKLYLFLDTRSASSANGILGLQPDAVTGKVVLTGDVDLKLRNALRRGEAIELNWRKLQDRTQDLKLRTNIPYLLNTPFGTDLSLRIFRRDTTFLEVNARGAVEYLMVRGGKLGLFINNKSSERLGKLNIATPGLADVDLLSYGMNLTHERFDYRFNPRKGHTVFAEGSVGNKRSTTALATGGEQPPVQESLQGELLGNGACHVPLKKRGTLRIAGQGGWMLNDNIFSNELFRVGGLKTMRGVDEASIFCSAYAIGTVEYRFLFEENGNFSAFVDLGWWEDDSREQYINDDPIGFGVGASFETKAGIFGITYALGQQFDNPIDLRESKVHFGFTTLF